MQIVIDIDDNVFTRLFDNGVETSSDDREVIDRAVRNGMPYEGTMQGNLISREALKKEFDIIASKSATGTWQLIPIKHIKQIIDNAPTVPLPDFKDGYKQAILDGKTNYPRPQGDVFPMEIVAGKCPIEVGGNCPLKTQGEWIRKEDIIHLLERWSDGYSYIEIPTDDAIKAIKELNE